MSAAGLTKAMRAALEDLDSASVSMKKRLHEIGLIRFSTLAGGWRTVEVTRRGDAALAAPRMTQAELEYLEFVEAGHWRASFSASGSRVRWQCIEKRWIRLFTSASDRLTPSGLKALNDVRAAMGSELYKDNMP